MLEPPRVRFEEFVRSLSSRLEAEKFEVHSPFEVGGLKVDFFAFRVYVNIYKRRIACLVTFEEKPTNERIQAHSLAAYQAAIRYHPLWQYAYMAFPVMASTAFTQQSISWVQGYQGKRYSWKDLTSHIEHPVLLDLSLVKAYHNTDRPPLWKGGPGVRTATDFASKYLAP